MRGADLVAATRGGDIQFVTVAEMAGITGLARMTIYRLVHDGSLEAIHFGRSIRIPVEAARGFLGIGTSGENSSVEVTLGDDNETQNISAATQDDQPEERLRLLSEALEGLGLDTRLDRYPARGTQGMFSDALRVSNPRAPDRGVAHVEDDGLVVWEMSGALDDAGLAQIAREVASVLRAGVVSLRRQARS
jgi:excisionase family DNA binding protein